MPWRATRYLPPCGVDRGGWIGRIATGSHRRGRRDPPRRIGMGLVRGGYDTPERHPSPKSFLRDPPPLTPLGGAIGCTAMREGYLPRPSPCYARGLQPTGRAACVALRNLVWLNRHRSRHPLQQFLEGVGGGRVAWGRMPPHRPSTLSITKGPGFQTRMRRRAHGQSFGSQSRFPPS